MQPMKTEPEQSGVKPDQSGLRQGSQQVTDMIQSYLQLLDGSWEASEQEKEQAYRRLKVLLKYQLVLWSPVPLLVSVMDWKDNTTKSTATAGYIRIPDALKGQISKMAEKLGCSENEAVLTVLSQNIGKYAKESEDDGDLDI